MLTFKRHCDQLSNYSTFWTEHVLLSIFY